MQSHRDQLVATLQQTLSANSEPARHCALAILDIRDFRELNRSFGFGCGDYILQEIAARISALHNEKFLSYYLGNDEFGVLLPELKSPGFAVIAAEQIASCFRENFEWNNHLLKISINIGIAYNYDHHDDAYTLVYDAELALKQAKIDNQPYRVLGKSAQPDSDQTKWALLNDLHTAMQQDELELYYQPKLALHSHRADERQQAEALIRWPSAEHGLVAPDVTIPLVEHLGSELDLVNWLVNTALKQLSELDGDHDCAVSVNVPANSVTSKTLYRQVADAIDLWQIQPSRLTLEITEDVLIADKELAFDHLSKIRDLGTRISIDDFGTGYSSLAYFKHIPADELKIDKMFVRQMLSSAADRKIANMIIELAHTFDLLVVAEGVEDSETLDTLADMGCDYAQGFLISKPLPFSSYRNWLDARKNAPQ